MLVDCLTSLHTGLWLVQSAYWATCCFLLGLHMGRKETNVHVGMLLDQSAYSLVTCPVCILRHVIGVGMLQMATGTVLAGRV
jgi:hypothetical protein